MQDIAVEDGQRRSFYTARAEYRWGLSRAGKPLVMMRTSKKKFRAALAAILSWIKKERSRLGTAALLIKLSQKLQGHWNYYGVRGNYAMLHMFYRRAFLVVFK